MWRHHAKRPSNVLLWGRQLLIDMQLLLGQVTVKGRAVGLPQWQLHLW